LNSIVLGIEVAPKAAALTEGAVIALLSVLGRDRDRSALDPARELLTASIFCLGSLCEHEDVRLAFVELGGLPLVVQHLQLGDMEVKRAAGYTLATIAEQVEFHGDIESAGGLPALISLALLEDIEAQEYAAFAIAHLATNRALQVPLVQQGVVRPLVTMLSSDAEPKHYAGLALLKLADNFENHLRIAEEGGIQALLRLGRSRTSDEQLQYKSALTLGQLATNAVKLLPQASQATMMNAAGDTRGAATGAGGGGPALAATQQQPFTIGDGANKGIAAISHLTMERLGSETLAINAKIAASPYKASSRVTERLRQQVAAQKEQGKDTTLRFLDNTLAKAAEERNLAAVGGGKKKASSDESPMVSRSLDTGMTPHQAAMRRSQSNEFTPMPQFATTNPRGVAVVTEEEEQQGEGAVVGGQSQQQTRSAANLFGSTRPL
jgi:hypothetical protein